LVDSVYCCEHGIEVEKVWKFEFPNGVDYLLAASNERKHKSMNVAHPLFDASNEKVETEISTEEQKELLHFWQNLTIPKQFQVLFTTDSIQ